MAALSKTNEQASQPGNLEEPATELAEEEQSISADTIIEQEQVQEDIDESISTPEIDSTKLQFAYKSFFLTSDYDLTNCDALARCDCCTSEVYFKNDSIFVYSQGCGGTTSYTKGTYSFNNKTLTLKHDSLLVINRQPFGDGEDKSEFGVSTERRYIKPTNYLIEDCGSQILLHWKGTTNNEYGTEEFQRNSLVYIINGADYSEIREKLELK